jgi:hypothetical protein
LHETTANTLQFPFIVDSFLKAYYFGSAGRTALFSRLRIGLSKFALRVGQIRSRLSR